MSSLVSHSRVGFRETGEHKSFSPIKVKDPSLLIPVRNSCRMVGDSKVRVGTHCLFHRPMMSSTPPQQIRRTTSTTTWPLHFNNIGQREREREEQHSHNQQPYQSMASGLTSIIRQHAPSTTHNIQSTTHNIENDILSVLALPPHHHSPPPNNSSSTHQRRLDRPRHTRLRQNSRASPRRAESSAAQRRLSQEEQLHRFVFLQEATTQSSTHRHAHLLSNNRTIRPPLSCAKHCHRLTHRAPTSVRFSVLRRVQCPP
jgi:hypothetical protein